MGLNAGGLENRKKGIILIKNFGGIKGSPGLERPRFIFGKRNLNGFTGKDRLAAVNEFTIYPHAVRALYPAGLFR